MVWIEKRKRGNGRMYIHEAVKKAMDMKKGKIYRKSTKRPEQDVYALVRPTNSYDTCQIIIYKNGKPQRAARTWNPTADDLAANDWECLEDEF